MGGAGQQRVSLLTHWIHTALITKDYYTSSATWIQLKLHISMWFEMQQWHFFNAIWVWDFCIHRNWKAVSERVQYCGVKSTGKTVGSPGHTIETGDVYGTYSSVVDSSSHLEYLPYWLLTVTNISKNHSALNFRIKHFKTSWSCKCLMSEEYWLWSWGYQGGLVHWNKPQVHSRKPTSIAAFLPQQYRNSRRSACFMLTMATRLSTFKLRKPSTCSD